MNSAKSYWFCSNAEKKIKKNNKKLVCRFKLIYLCHPKSKGAINPIILVKVH
jgi:hypothetical protein